MLVPAGQKMAYQDRQLRLGNTNACPMADTYVDEVSESSLS